MWLSTALALITAVSALITLAVGAKKEHRRLYKHEWLFLLFAFVTFGAAAYQSWKVEYDKKVADLLTVDWEKDLDNPITDVRISFIYANGSTVESSAASQAEAFRFEFQGASATTTLRLSRGTDGNWHFSKDSEPSKPVLAVVYGSPLKIEDKRYCWWSDSWGAPAPLYMKDSNGKEWTERSLCAIQLGIPLTDFPLTELRSLSGLKRVSVYLDKDPGKQLCDGDCHEQLVSILLTTKDNQFDISPLRDMQPAVKNETISWSSTGEGIRERLKVLFIQQNGISIRESMKERMTPVDEAQHHEEVLRVPDPFHPVSIIPNIPNKILENAAFIARYGQGRDLVRQDKWCGFADHRDLCIHRFIAYIPPESKN